MPERLQLLLEIPVLGGEIIIRLLLLFDQHGGSLRSLAVLIIFRFQLLHGTGSKVIRIYIIIHFTFVPCCREISVHIIRRLAAHPSLLRLFPRSLRAPLRREALGGGDWGQLLVLLGLGLGLDRGRREGRVGVGDQK